jgi:hypothetical protein
VIRVAHLAEHHRAERELADGDSGRPQGQYLVSLDLPVIGQALQASADEPFAVFSMTLKPAAIAPLLLETVNTARPPAFSGLAVSDATPELLDLVVRLLRLLDRPDDLRVLAPGLEREILWRLVTGD